MLVLFSIKNLLKMSIQVLGVVPPQHQQILSPAALKFVATLHRTFNSRRKELLKARVARQLKIEQGSVPDFLPETKWIREDPTWRVDLFNQGCSSCTRVGGSKS